MVIVSIFFALAFTVAIIVIAGGLLDVDTKNPIAVVFFAIIFIVLAILIFIGMK